MIDIFVMRGAGDKRGEDITSPLLTSLAAALQRGQVEIDSYAPSRTVQISAKFRTGLKTGQIVRVLDSLQGAVWNGKIVSIDNGVSGPSLTTNLTVQRMT